MIESKPLEIRYGAEIIINNNTTKKYIKTTFFSLLCPPSTKTFYKGMNSLVLNLMFFLFSPPQNFYIISFIALYLICIYRVFG